MAAKNRSKLFELFRHDGDALIYLQGGTVMHRYDTDYEFAFRQESNFLYLTGVSEPDFQMVMDLQDNTWHLVIPRRDTKYAVWMGYVNPPKYYREKFKPDGVLYDDELETVLKKRAPKTIYCLDKGQASMIGAISPGKNVKVDTETLRDALAYCRCTKTEEELEYLRKASKVASEAHREAMKALKPGMREYEMKAVFDYVNLKNGLVHAPYNGIHAAGKNSAILHYVENSAIINDGDLYLVDAGSEYKGYAADITRTYPANGKFTEMQGVIYDIVLQAHSETIAGARPGVKMEDLQLHAARVILKGLADAGLLKGKVEEMMNANVFALFFPHGLGHFLGLDTHDVGGYPKGVEPIDRPGLKFLRARRTLEKGMVITIEPGIYFIPALLEPAFEDEKYKAFLNKAELTKLLGFGGIRLEDNLIITETGHENMTDVPVKRKDVEAFMGG